MCYKVKYISISLILLLISEGTLCQTKSDSLWSVWVNAELEDTTRLDALLKHGVEIIKKNTDSTFSIANIGYQYADEHNLLNYQSKALIIKGKALYRKGKYDQAEETFNESLKLAREVADSLLVARSIHGYWIYLLCKRRL